MGESLFGGGILPATIAEADALSATSIVTAALMAGAKSRSVNDIFATLGAG